MFAAGVIAAVLVAAGVYLAQPPVREIRQTAVARRSILVQEHFRGRVVAPPGAYALLNAPYSATVSRVHKKAGDKVFKGDVLVTLHLPNYYAHIDGAAAALSRAEADLAKAQAAGQRDVQAARVRYEKAAYAERKARKAGKGVANGLVLRRVALHAAWKAISEQSSATVAVKRRAVDAAREDLYDAEAGHKRALVRAPMDGRVAQVLARQGRVVKTSAPLIAVVQASDLVVQVPVSDAVEKGQAVELSFSGDRLLEGRVSRLVPSLDGRRGLATVTFDGSSVSAQGGERVEVRRLVDESWDTLAVPRAALSKQRTVTVLRGGRWVEVPVRVGVTDGEWIEIVDGVGESEPVQLREQRT